MFRLCRGGEVAGLWTCGGTVWFDMEDGMIDDGYGYYEFSR